MYRRMITLSVLFIGIVVFTVGSAYIGYLFFAERIPDTDGGMVLSAYDDGITEMIEVGMEETGELGSGIKEAGMEDVLGAMSASENSAGADPESRITGNTRIIYEYVTDTESEGELREVNMPLYFLGMSEESLNDALIEGWSIKEFSEEIVILQRTVKQSSQDMYTLGVHNGYIAVFYNGNTLVEDVKETTSTPISALSIEEQNRLLDGILITDDEQLVKVLEDYGS